MIQQNLLCAAIELSFPSISGNCSSLTNFIFDNSTSHNFGCTMSSEELAQEIRSYLPGTEDVIVQYLAGYLIDDAGEEEDVLHVAHDILQSVAGDRDVVVEKLMLKLGDLLAEQLNARIKNKSRPKLQKLDKVMDMSKTQISNTIALSEGVDLESINKGKCVMYILLMYLCL